MFSKNLRSEFISRFLESVPKKRVYRLEVSRAKSEKPPDPIGIFDKHYESRIEGPKPIYTQGYPSMRSANPYEREPYLCYTEQPGQSLQNASGFPLNASGFPQNTTAFPHNAAAFPYNKAGFAQNETGFPQYAAESIGKCDCVGPCCCGVGGGGQDPKAPSGSSQNIMTPMDSVGIYPYCPLQPCQFCGQNPCCCSRCGPCAPHGNWCIPKMDCCGRRIVPPIECRPGSVPPNPCCPQYPKKGIAKIYRSIFFFICIPVIILQFFHAMSHEPCPKLPCREYEYMRTRTKRYPWGDGVETFFHNEEINHLPGDCGPPELVCEP